MELASIVRCPRCKGPLASHDGAFDCHACRLRYPAPDGIPMFIATDAEPLADDRRGPAQR